MAPLLARKSGVDHAFERLYRRHAADVYRYAVAVLRNQADAEDVVQTTFLNAYRALDRGERPTTPHNWLIAIAHNVCRQRFRQASRRPLEVGLEDDIADHFVEPEDDNAPSPEDIRRAMQHLAFNQRAALVMRELEGRSYAEIADVLELSVGAVETLIFRARRALREQLETSVTCGQAEHLISRQLDGALARPERSQLRAHLRECAACRTIARSQRAQKSAWKALGAVPLPSSLASLFGGGASVGTAVAAKAAAVVITAGVATGVGLDAHHRLMQPTAHHRTAPASTTVRPASPRTQIPSAAGPVTVAVRRVQPQSHAGHSAARVETNQTHTAAPPPAAQQPATTTPGEATAPPTAVKQSHGATSHEQSGAQHGRAAVARAAQGSHGRGHAKKTTDRPAKPTPARTAPPSDPSRSRQHETGNGTGRGNAGGPPQSDDPGQGQGQGRGKTMGEAAPLTTIVPTVTTPAVSIPIAPPVPTGGRGH